MNKCSHKQMNDFALRLVAIEQELHRAGMHATAIRVNEAVQQIGWEFARKLDKAKEQANG